MFGVATGWLGWTPDAALAANMEHIRMAHDGRYDMLKAIFGDGEEKVETRRAQTPVSELTPAAFDAWMG